MQFTPTQKRATSWDMLTALVSLALWLMVAMSTPSVVAMVAVVYGLGQLITSSFLIPRLAGERIGLHPLEIVFASLSRRAHFVSFGTFLVLPIRAVLLVALRQSYAQVLSSQLYQTGDQ